LEANMGNARPSTDLYRWSTGQVVLATIVTVLIALAVWFAYSYMGVVALLFLGIILGVAIQPIVDWLYRRGLPRALAVVAVYIVLAALLVAFVFLVEPLIVDQVAAVSASLPGYYERLRLLLTDSSSWILRRLGERVPPTLPFGDLEAPTGEGNGVEPLVGSLRYAGVVLRAVLSAVAILLFGFYWNIENRWLLQYLSLAAAPERRDDVEDVVHAVEARVGGFVRAEAMLCLVVGGLSLIAYLLIGLPYAVVLAVIAGIMEVVPMVGPALGAIPAILVGLSVSPTTALWVLVAAGAVQLIENQLLVPRIVRSLVGVNPVLTLIAVAGATSLFGVAGVLLAVPLAAVGQFLLDRYVIHGEEGAGADLAGRGRENVIRYQARDLAQDARRQLQEGDGEPGVQSVTDAIEEIAHDLDRLLAGEETAEEVL
jgi:predicted PurR-regulated permease PerM